MSPIGVVVVVLAALAAFGCNAERKQECEKLLAAMTPLERAAPSGASERRDVVMPSKDEVDRVKTNVAALHLNDAPLAVYADNSVRTLTVLSNTLELKASASAPDGTDDVIRAKLGEARIDRQDVERYCAQ